MNTTDRLQQLLDAGQISRRNFLKRMSVLGLTIGASTSMLAGVSSAATPQKGGLLKVGIAGGHTTDTLEPGLTGDHMAGFVQWQVKNNLVEIDHRGRPIPELAESWEPGKDATSWVFNLRRGVEFHNGKSFAVEDVIYSLNIHRGENSKSAGKTLLDSVKDMKADGKHKLVITLNEGNADFPVVLSSIRLPMVPAGDKAWRVGTGGYILVDFEPGVRALVKRNPNYWKAGRAHFDEILTLCIEDTMARSTALVTGTVDIMCRCDYKTMNHLAKTPGIRLIQLTGALHYPFPMRTDMHPYDNNDVRLALKYGVDRNQMLKMILRDCGSVGNDHPIGPTYRYHNAELPQREYDPDKARYHLKKAGLENEVFTLYASEAAFNGAVDAAVLYKEQAAKAGIKMEVVKCPKDGYWKSVWMNKTWTQSYYSGTPTEDWMLTMAYAKEAEWNETFWQHARFNRLLKDARAELNTSLRREMYGEMQQILWEEGGTVIPLFADNIDACTNKLKFDKLARNYELDGLRCSERWWFES